MKAFPLTFPKPKDSRGCQELGPSGWDWREQYYFQRRQGYPASQALSRAFLFARSAFLLRACK